MFSSFLAYVLLGLSISIPVGTVSIEMMKQGLKNGFFYGWFVGIGGMTFDVTMIVFIYLGFSTVLNLPIIQVIMWLLGCIFLFYLSLDGFRESKKGIHIDGDTMNKSLKKSYLSGLMVAVSPSNIVFWVGVFGSVLASSLGPKTETSFLVVAAGILCGILLHDVALMSIIHFTRKLVNQKFVTYFSKGAGVFLLGFSVYFGYEFIIKIMEMF